jgi:phosphatidylcholine synthase
MAQGGRPEGRGTGAEQPDWRHAFCVHVFTAAGAACALLAMLAASRAEWVTMFVWLGAALLIDGIDGTFARRLRVAEVLPRWSGEVLDLVIDYCTYVFIPAFALLRSGLLPEQAAIPLCLGIVVSGALYFADRDMKIGDHYFRGFPALWNGVAFHLFVLKPAPWISAAVIVMLIALSFAPYRSLHPMRAIRFRVLTIAVLSAWSALAIYALVRNFDPGLWPALALSVLGLYLLFAGAWIARGETRDAE